MPIPTKDEQLAICRAYIARIEAAMDELMETATLIGQRRKVAWDALLKHPEEVGSFIISHGSTLEEMKTAWNTFTAARIQEFDEALVCDKDVTDEMLEHYYQAPAVITEPLIMSAESQPVLQQTVESTQQDAAQSGEGLRST